MKQHHVKILEESIEKAHDKMKIFRNLVDSGNSVVANQELRRIKRNLEDALRVIGLQEAH